MSRGHIANIELGRSDPSFDLVERVALALDLDIDFVARPPVVIGGEHQRDIVHAICSGYVDRHLRRGGWSVAREVEIVHGRSHGWIDLLTFHPRDRTLVIVEIKTRLDDIGAIERQIGWYQRSADDVAARLGWQPTRILGWVLLLASEEVDAVISRNRDLLSRAFPVRTDEMSGLLDRPNLPSIGRGLALIDPTSRRQRWLIKARADGRRSPAPYVDYADAARRFRC